MASMVNEKEAKGHLAASLEAIKRFRGLTDEDIAGIVDSTKMTINRACRGENLPSVILLGALGEFFGYQIEELITDSEKVALREELRSRREKSLIPA